MEKQNEEGVVAGGGGGGVESGGGGAEERPNFLGARARRHRPPSAAHGLHCPLEGDE
jgi:hypothetical protein